MKKPEIENENFSAFPTIVAKDALGNTYHTYGLTKREYFAARAMQGLVSNSDAVYDLPRELASDAVNIADALIEALNK